MLITESARTLCGPWLETFGSGNVSPVISSVNDLDRTAHDIRSELEQNNLRAHPGLTSCLPDTPRRTSGSGPVTSGLT